jgi:Holliday junction resolvasome RuvABC endonuclease subunit
MHPSSWRKVTHGKGNAKKEDTLNWVNEVYDLALTAKENDIADAIGIAYAGVSYFMGEDNGETGDKVS